MSCSVSDFGNDYFVYDIKGVTKEELESKLNLFFSTEKLILKSEIADEKIFQKGNKWLRIFLGVFVKYFKITVSIVSKDNLFSVRLHRSMNFAMSGGLMGLKASRTEFERINQAFKIYFSN